jgi:monooxygenase
MSVTTRADSGSHEVEAVEALDVLIVGAGLSGVGAACYVSEKCSWASFAVFEAREAMGGTWDLFRYPGIRSDSDMFTLGYSFRPWASEQSLAGGADIRRYITDTAGQYGIEQKIRYRHRVTAAEWSTDNAAWLVTAERTDTGETVRVKANFLFSCTGYYNYERGYLPEFPGMERFGGEIIHPQFWPEDLDYAGKKVVVIGSGATAVTLVPSLTDKAAHVTMLQRSPTYIASIPEANPMVGVLRKRLPRKWADPAIRWFNVLAAQGLYQVSRRRPEMVKRFLRKGLERELSPDYDIDTHFSPRYNPWDQRMCFVPDADLFKAIKTGAASVVTDRVKEFTPTGITLESGTELEADVVVTATGLELQFMGGVDLTVDGDKVDVHERMVYKGMMLEGVPNAALAIGYTNASWTLKAELTCQYVCRLLDYLHRSGLRQCTPVNRETELSEEPLLGLASGYIQRSIQQFPRQGQDLPWRVHQSYLKDYRSLKTSSIHDGTMAFSNPVTHREPLDLTEAGSDGSSPRGAPAGSAVVGSPS